MTSSEAISYQTLRIIIIEIIDELSWKGDLRDAQTTLCLGLGIPAGPILGGVLGVWLGTSLGPIPQAVLGVILGILLILPGFLVGGGLGVLLGTLLYPVLRIPVLGGVLSVPLWLMLVIAIVPWTSILEKRKARLAGLAGTVAGAVLGMWLGEASGAILGVWLGIWVGIMVLLLLEKLYGVFI